MFMPGPEQEGALPVSTAADSAFGLGEDAAAVVLEDATGAGFTATSSLRSRGLAEGDGLGLGLGLGLGVELGVGLGSAGTASLFCLYSTAIPPSGVSVSTT